MFCHNVSLSIILKHGSNGNIKGNIELSDNVKASLTTSILNDFKLLLNKDSKSVLILGINRKIMMHLKVSITPMN